MCSLLRNLDDARSHFFREKKMDIFPIKPRHTCKEKTVLIIFFSIEFLECCEYEPVPLRWFCSCDPAYDIFLSLENIPIFTNNFFTFFFPEFYIDRVIDDITIGELTVHPSKLPIISHANDKIKFPWISSIEWGKINIHQSNSLRKENIFSFF